MKQSILSVHQKIVLNITNGGRINYDKRRKNLVLEDLCARLPYGVMALTEKGKGHICAINLTIFGTKIEVNINSTVRNAFGIEDIKPYLFPISSMTDGQKKEYREVCELDTEILVKHPMDDTPFPALYYSQDWLTKNHFDYRGLIEKGLAIDATGLNVY